MNYWFTADTHFRHSNIIKYCNRPFKDSVEMNESMISNWNNVVKDGDIVYHLGDFGFVKSQFEFNLYFKRLKGLIILIKGNHDNSIWNYRHSFYSHSDSYREIEINNQKITLCHYAMKVWNKSHSGAWHLYGHSHGSLPDDPHSLSFDVGVDCHNYTPINFDQVKDIMSKKFWKPIDHHGERKDGGGIGATPEEYAKLERKRYYEQLKEEFEKIKIKIEHWEADEYVLIFAGKVRGHTLSKHNAEFVKNYLQTLDFNDIALSVLSPKEVDEH